MKIHKGVKLTKRQMAMGVTLQDLENLASVEGKPCWDEVVEHFKAIASVAKRGAYPLKRFCEKHIGLEYYFMFKEELMVLFRGLVCLYPKHVQCSFTLGLEEVILL